MQKLLLIICIAALAFASSCTKSAVCDCTVTENEVVVDNPTYHSAGHDPTCDDFEYSETEDSVTTIVTCVAR